MLHLASRTKPSGSLAGTKFPIRSAWNLLSRRLCIALFSLFRTDPVSVPRAEYKRHFRRPPSRQLQRVKRALAHCVIARRPWVTPYATLGARQCKAVRRSVVGGVHEEGRWSCRRLMPLGGYRAAPVGLRSGPIGKAGRVTGPASDRPSAPGRSPSQDVRGKRSSNDGRPAVPAARTRRECGCCAESQQQQRAGKKTRRPWLALRLAGPLPPSLPRGRRRLSHCAGKAVAASMVRSAPSGRALVGLLSGAARASARRLRGSPRCCVLWSVIIVPKTVRADARCCPCWNFRRSRGRSPTDAWAMKTTRRGVKMAD